MEHTLLADVVNGIVLFDGDSNSNAKWSVGDVIDQYAQALDLLFSEFGESPSSLVEKSTGVSPWKDMKLTKLGLLRMVMMEMKWLCCGMLWRSRHLWIVMLKKKLRFKGRI